MSRKEDKAKKGPVDNVVVRAAYDKFLGLHPEQAKYHALTDHRLGVRGKDNTALFAKVDKEYFPWTGPIMGSGQVVTLSMAEWMQAAEVGSI